MLDPDLQKLLETINTNLTEIKNKKVAGVWRAFFNGMFGALGYLVGVVVVIVIVGWVLNKTGLVKPFEEQWQRFQTFMYQAENTMSATQSQQGSGTSGALINLPGGHKAQIVQ